MLSFNGLKETGGGFNFSKREIVREKDLKAKGQWRWVLPCRCRQLATDEANKENRLEPIFWV